MQVQHQEVPHASVFAGLAPVRYEGPGSDNPLAYRYYDPNRMVLGRRMEEQLRIAVCYWHSFCWNGSDPFGAPAFQRPWFEEGEALARAEHKAAEAFEFLRLLGVPYYCFHDRDVAPEGSTARASRELFLQMVERLAAHQEHTGVKLLWGTANLFSHRRYLAGAATNPDPEIFALAALQVRDAMNATHQLGGANYVLWGGREGYETLLNTDMSRELDQLGRFLALAVEHKHKIGFKGAILVEPKPREPSKHQYDFDTATVYGFLCRYGLEHEVKVNIEANHATLSGHTFEHEIATAATLGIFGSLDINRGDPQLGWDTDQFPNNVPDTALALYQVLQAGGFGTGGCNFDAKVRRQSIDPVDLLHGHVGGIDVLARGLLAAERLLKDGSLARALEARYSGWDGDLGARILKGRCELDDLAEHALAREHDVLPVSGRQEYLENLFNRFV
ncbi:MAG: xylose isomerase [Gammaproteobacteria bacterium]